MNKYIDSKKLIAEIEQLKEANKTPTKHVSEYIQGGIYGFDLAVEKILAIITSLQQEQPETDLEKEANECWDYVFSAIGWDENSLMTMNHKEFLAFARHFAEWGAEHLK